MEVGSCQRVASASVSDLSLSLNPKPKEPKSETLNPKALSLKPPQYGLKDEMPSTHFGAYYLPDGSAKNTKCHDAPL